jgi:hypothetical protein
MWRRHDDVLEVMARGGVARGRPGRPRALVALPPQPPPLLASEAMRRLRSAGQWCKGQSGRPNGLGCSPPHNARRLTLVARSGGGGAEVRTAASASMRQPTVQKA